MSELMVSRRTLLAAGLGAAGIAAGGLSGLSAAGAAPIGRGRRRPGLDLPPTSQSGVARAQIFDANVPDQSVYDGRVSFVWGTHTPKADWLPGVSYSYYWPAFRDHSYPLDWYLANHPDWPVYKADRTTIAFPTSDHSYIPLDVSNPEVREFYWDHNIQPAIDARYDTISLDNLQVINTFGLSGVYDKDGQWVQQYTGEFDDPAFADMVLSWLTWLTRRIHRAGLSVAGNMWWSSRNYGPEIELLRQSAGIMDIYVDETGFTRLGNPVVYTDAKWRSKFEFFSDVAASRSLVAINKTTTAHLADTPAAYQEWVMANYFLAWTPTFMMTMCGTSEYSYFVDSPYLNVNLGAPTGAAAEDAAGLWTRGYESGLVAVNPSSSAAATLSLPAGQWVGVDGQGRSGDVTVPAASGLVLTRAG